MLHLPKILEVTYRFGSTEEGILQIYSYVIINPVLVHDNLWQQFWLFYYTSVILVGYKYISGKHLNRYGSNCRQVLTLHTGSRANPLRQPERYER